ncbi:sensor histidine kinase [Tsukamurella sp. PLM1]|uniref:sensor histidine kinase n=1 Tax=Tsukamurella sp. PLM1 TaxID=2929795 RepID=UPI0020640B77|nr:ATP-binding protein [Tsukamurella sp. PLM1]BDH55719.1 hypothetical protein MTP03_06580 [Tsukamurella sp. PLM1]
MAALTSADERLTRVFARFIAAGYLFDLTTTFGSVVDAWRVAPWLTAVTTTAVFGGGAALLPSSFARDYRRAIGRTAVVAAAVFLLSTCAWILADALDPIQLAGDHFLYFIPALAAMAVAMPARPAVAAVYGVTVVGAAVVLNRRVGAGHDPLLPSLLFALAFSAVFLTASMVAWRVGRRLDAAHEEALEATAAEAAAQARGHEQQRFAALVHDDVIATLLAATRVDAPSAVARHAGTVLATLDRYGEHDDLESVPAAEAAAVVAATVTRLAPHGAWVADVPDDAETVPSGVLTAVTAAVGESLRNVVRHAGPGARVQVRAGFAADGVTVRVSDDGVGFDPGAVAPDRLGVAGSIVGRMRAVPGGTAVVESAPGAGTTVTVGWRR